MAASTIPNSGGPGSRVELSSVTIAVRDKVIEKFADQPLEEINESVKKLLSREEDEQKRLGILAARVYILRQRILRLAEEGTNQVVAGSSPSADDLVADNIDDIDLDTGTSEWTRLRILDDCEVNGVRFPKTVIIDVKSEDAERLIENGKAELIVEDPVPSSAGSDIVADAEPANEEMPAAMEPDAATESNVSEMADANGQLEANSENEDDLSALSAELETAPAPQMEVDEPPVADESADSEGEAVIDAPSAAEVTAALEALSTNTEEEEEDETASAPPPSADDMLAALGGDDEDAADVAAELEAMSAAFNPPADTTSTEAPEDGDEDDKPSGWFQAQQDAEQSARTDTDNNGEDNQEDEKS